MSYPRIGLKSTKSDCPVSQIELSSFGRTCKTHPLEGQAFFRNLDEVDRLKTRHER
jgi:hypothetical protein